MRHQKHTFKIGRTASHRRCMIANMLKALIEKERIETTLTKAKELRRHADKMVTLAKKNTLASRRQAVAGLMISYNALTPKEARLAKSGNQKAYNTDRRVISKLFGPIAERFATRQGGYTRIVKHGDRRVGDNAETCSIEYIPQ
jgi:large subunit ribosomal protein L17